MVRGEPCYLQKDYKLEIVLNYGIKPILRKYLADAIPGCVLGDFNQRIPRFPETTVRRLVRWMALKLQLLDLPKKTANI